MTTPSLYYTDAHGSTLSRRECEFPSDFLVKNKTGSRSVAIIGCTYVFTDSILRSEMYNGVERIVFCDLHAQKAHSYLSMAGQASGRIRPEHLPVLQSRTHIAEAVQDADTVYVGIGPSFVNIRRVLEIYRKHGVFVAIGDTLYSPGLIQLLLEYPTLVQIREAVHERASSDCVIFASANPLPEVVGVLSDGGRTAHPVYGFCCGSKDLRRLYESYLEMEHPGLTLEYACRNHLGAVQVFDQSGRNVLPDLLDRLNPDRLFHEIVTNGPKAHKALEDWPLALIMHHYYDPGSGSTLTSESGVHGVEYLPRLFLDENRKVKYPASTWEHDLIRRQDRTEEPRSRIISDPLGYELSTAWAIGRFDPWSQLLRNLSEDPTLTENDLRSWGPAYVNLPNGDLFPELPPNAVVEAPVTYYAGRMFAYRNSVPLSDSYLEMVYSHLKMVEMAGCITRSTNRVEAADTFEWMIDACPLVRAFLPTADARQALAFDLLEAVPEILPVV